MNEPILQINNTIDSIKQKLKKKIEFISSKIIKTSLITILSGMSILIVYQVFARYILNSPSSMSEELLRFGLIWLGILGAGLCFFKEKHLNLPFLIDIIPERHKDKIVIFNILINTTLGIILCIGGWLAVIKNADYLTPTLKLSMGGLQSVLVITGALIIISQTLALSQCIKKNNKNILVIGTYVVSFSLLTFLFGTITRTLEFEELLWNNLELLSFIVLFTSFFSFMILGTPIAVGLAFSGLLTLGLQIDVGDLIVTSGEKLFSGLDNFGFLALPFFILAGNIMNQGGIAKRLISFAMLLGKRIPGSLWQTNIIANMLFGCLSGSPIAAATAIGSVITPMAREKKYNMPFTTAVNATSSLTGMMIPPTGVFIIYSLITGGEASIAALFLAGYVPGIMLGLSVMIVAYVYARKNNYPTDKTKYTTHEISSAIASAIPSLFLIVLVIGGIIGGIFTAIEASGIAVLYSLILSIIYRNMTYRKLLNIIYESAQGAAVILFLIACSGLMSWSMAFASIPYTIGQFLSQISDNILVILLVINIALLIVGIFMDMAPALLIFTPILYPIVTSLGIDPVHFGVVMVYNLSIGIVTPPVGTVLFVACGISGEKITNVIRPLLPIFALQFLGLMLITYFPFLSLTIPKLFGLL